MKQARVTETLLAAAATVGAVLPVTTLVAPGSAWVPPAVIVVLAVAAVGMLGRSRGWARHLVLPLQVVAAALMVYLLHGRGHLFFGLPTPDATHAFGILLTEAGLEVFRGVAPLPASRGLSLAIGILVALVALAVDAIGVGWRRPAVAGLPLLAAFLVSAANAGTGLAWWWFLPAAVPWLGLLAAQGVGSLRLWSTVRARGAGSAPPPSAPSSYVGLARVLGMGALAVAIVVPTLLPHLPLTFIGDGLGTDGRGGGGGRVTLTSTVDISRNLESQSTDPVIRYERSTPLAEPFRVGVIERYTDGEWQPRSQTRGRRASAANPDIPRTEVEVRVTENQLRAPQLAVPHPATGLRMDGVDWYLDADGVPHVSSQPEEYSATALVLNPREEDFLGDAPGFFTTALSVDPALEPTLRELNAEVVPDDATPLQQAQAIQTWLRSSEFSYSTELVDDGRGTGEPLLDFLRTKQGYCVQFTSAMVMMARQEGIPARMAIGFLPGRADGDEVVIRAADAHAWPELWFPDLGWVRFEPTPGVRSGSAPAYTVPAADPSATTSSAATSSSSAAPSTSAPTDNPTETGDTGTQQANPVLTWLRERTATILALLAIALAAAALPVGAWMLRRARRRRARDEAAVVEAEWRSLLSRLEDIGVYPADGATPRQAGAQIRRDAYLRGESDLAMGRLVATLERTRYGGGESDEHAARDARLVWRHAFRSRRLADRVRAALAPRDGVVYWRRLGARLDPRRLLRR